LEFSSLLLFTTVDRERLRGYARLGTAAADV